MATRILIDLPQTQIDALKQLASEQGRPRAAIIREALDAYIATHRRPADEDLFGVWRHRHIDGLAYQEEIRAEW